MPIYEYRCTQCERVTDVLQLRLNAAPPKCKSCGSAEVERLISRTSFQLKGSGWYTSDYSKSAGGGVEASGAAKSDAGSDAKADASPKGESTDKTITSSTASGCGAGQCANCTPSA